MTVDVFTGIKVVYLLSGPLVLKNCVSLWLQAAGSMAWTPS